jgi:hypothetical protein
MTSIKLCNECSQVETQFYKVRLFEPQMTKKRFITNNPQTTVCATK